MPQMEMMSPQRDSLGPQIGIFHRFRSSTRAEILNFHLLKISKNKSCDTVNPEFSEPVKIRRESFYTITMYN